MRAEARIAEAFQSGGGMFWGEHDPDLFVGTERFFRPVIRRIWWESGFRRSPA